MSTQRTDSPDASSADAAVFPQSAHPEERLSTGEGESRDDVDRRSTTVPDFTPVLLRYRHDGWTPERQRRYVAALARTGHAGKAARAVGMTEQSAAKLRRRPDAASFDTACLNAYLGARRRWRTIRLLAANPRLAERFGFSLPQGSGNL